MGVSGHTTAKITALHALTYHSLLDPPSGLGRLSYASARTDRCRSSNAFTRQRSLQYLRRGLSVANAVPHSGRAQTRIIVGRSGLRLVLTGATCRS